MPKGKRNANTQAKPRNPKRQAHVVLTATLQKMLKGLEASANKVQHWNAGKLVDDLRSGAAALNNALGCLADLPEDFHPGKPGFGPGTEVTVKPQYAPLYDGIFDVLALLTVVSTKNSHLTCSAKSDDHEIIIVVPRRHVEIFTAQEASA